MVTEYGSPTRNTKPGTLTPTKTGTDVSRKVAKMMSAIIEKNAV
jgi:hypothetical protein